MKGERSTWKNFRRLTVIFPQSWLLKVSVVCIAVSAGIEILYSHLLKSFVDTALAKDSQGFWQALIMVIVMALIDIILIYCRRKMIGKYSEQGIRGLRVMVAEKLSALPVNELESKHSGDYVSRITNDINRVRNFATVTVFSLVFYPLAAILAFTYVFILSWKLTLVSTFGVPLLLFGASLLGKPIAKYTTQLQEHLGRVNSLAQDSISGVEVARSFELHERLTNQYSEAVACSVRSAKNVAKRNGFLKGFSETLSFFPFIICFGIGGYWAIQGDLTPGSLLVFVNLLNHLTFPVAQLPQIIGNLRGDMAAAERVFEILDLPDEREDGQVYNISQADQVIEFSQVSFGYQDQNILNQLSFTVNKGETVALVGPSGGGKSTVIKLIQGFYQNYHGKIRLFGSSLEDWNLSGVREQMALVAQDTYLFPGSIKENIGYGKPGATEEEIIEAAKAANAHEFIVELKDGYDTQVGELGGKLSGGQKQRISIARAILKDAPLLLLDEATSALDTGSELLVQQAIDRFMVGKTTLVIAHRLSTIRKADRIFVIDQGQIVEEGTHEDLLARGGAYRQLYLRHLSAEQSIARGEVV